MQNYGIGSWSTPKVYFGSSLSPFFSRNYFMDSAQHCLDQSAECRRLMKSAQSEAEAYALKLLARSWSGLAGQIDRYNALVRQQPPAARKDFPERPCEQGPP
jgi:hypothetical protein